jgi:hypothetical protein
MPARGLLKAGGLTSWCDGAFWEQVVFHNAWMMNLTRRRINEWFVLDMRRITCRK